LGAYGLTTYIAYIDDSGNENRAVYLALLIPVEHWNTTLREWLDFRAQLYTGMQVPATVELHAKDVVQPGKGTLAPGIKYGVNTDAGKRKKLLNLAVAQIGVLSHARIVSFQDTLITPEQCYERLLKRLESLLLAEDSWAIAVVDGQDTDPVHKRVHRRLKLASRRILEDPWKQDSKHSQLVQMADIAAYSLHQGHELFPSRQFMWGWMKTYLHAQEWPGHCNCPV
jgi:Protein of unknown function (DUF3800)